MFEKKRNRLRWKCFQTDKLKFSELPKKYENILPLVSTTRFLFKITLRNELRNVLWPWQDKQRNSDQLYNLPFTRKSRDLVGVMFKILNQTFLVLGLDQFK